jgi:hypothetical protein
MELKSNGKFKSDYNSFEKRLDLFSKPTHWEINHGVTIKEKKVIDLTEDLKIAIISKSDNTNTMVIFYNGSKRADPCWFGWMPSEDQINSFPKIKEIYDEINQENSKNKIGGDQSEKQE